MTTLTEPRNYKPKMQLVNNFLTNTYFTTGVNEYLNGKPFKEFRNKNEQFLYERGRQFAAHLTYLGYDENVIKNNVNWLVKELVTATRTKALI